MNLLFNGGSGTTTGGGGGGGGFAGPLHRDGLNLKTADGRIWKYRGFTGFRAPELWAKGERQWVQDYHGGIDRYGGNTIRVFARWNNTGYCPEANAHFYEDLEAYCLAAQPLYVHLVVSCDQVSGSSVRVPLSVLHDSARQIGDIAKRVGNVLIECSNEDFKNGTVSASFDPAWFAGSMATRSTWYTHSDEDPETPGAWMDWATVHPGGDPEWTYEGPKILAETQKLGLGQFPPARRPAILGEPRRIAEGTTPRQWADHAFHAENFGAGSCVHGGFKSFPPAAHHESDLQNCKMPTSGLALECIEAVRDVWTSGLINPQAAELGRYLRGQQDGGGECPIVHKDIEDGPDGCGRSYFMEVGGVMHGGAIDPGPANTGAVPRNGWRIEKQGGYVKDGRGGNILELHR